MNNNHINTNTNTNSDSKTTPSNKTFVITSTNFIQIANLPLDQCKSIISSNKELLIYQHPISSDSLLHLAVQKQNYSLTQFLLEQTVNVNITNRLNQTPLHIAVETKNHMIINSLLENKADANSQDYKGDTPMHIAADNGEYKVIKLLLLYKANPLIQNANGAFPLDNAIEKRHQKCIDVLAQTRSFSDKQLTVSTGNPNERNRLDISNTNLNGQYSNIYKDNDDNKDNDNDEDKNDNKPNCYSACAKDRHAFKEYENILNKDVIGKCNTNIHTNSNNNATDSDKKDNAGIIYYKKKCILNPKINTKKKKEFESPNNQLAFKKIDLTEDNKEEVKANNTANDIISGNSNSNNTTNTNTKNNSNCNSNREEKNYNGFNFSISISQSKINDNKHCVVSLEDNDEALEPFIEDNNNAIYTYQSSPNDIILNSNTYYRQDTKDSKVLISYIRQASTPLSSHRPITYSKSKEYNGYDYGYDDIDTFLCNVGSPTQDITESPNLIIEDTTPISTPTNNNNNGDEGIINNDIEIFTKASSDCLEIIEPELQKPESELNEPASSVSSMPTQLTPQNLESELEAFLKEINMEIYKETFLKEGFDDLKLIINQMKSGFGITDSNLKEIGISKPGHRARILIKLEDMSNGFNFLMPDNAVYYMNPKPFKTLKYDFKVKALINWLKEIKMEGYISQLYEAGYHSIELLYIQMISKNPLTDDILEHEIGIEKVGYRTRLINKIQEEAKEYIKQLKTINNGQIELTTKKTMMNIKGCECIIF